MDYSALIEPDDVTGQPYIFVSYSRKDMDSVQSVLRILKINHFRFWYDKGLKSGLEWAEELGEKIDQCDQFLVLISPNSIESKYVRKEVGMAMEKEKNILVLYLEETVLSSGLQLLLGNIQAIHKSFFYNESDFEKVLCESLSNNTLYQNTTVFSFAEDNQYFGSIPSKNAFNRFLDNYLLLGLIGKGGLAIVLKVFGQECRLL